MYIPRGVTFEQFNVTKPNFFSSKQHKFLYKLKQLYDLNEELYGYLGNLCMNLSWKVFYFSYKHIVDQIMKNI